jgi:hypothetical protein
MVAVADLSINIAACVVVLVFVFTMVDQEYQKAVAAVYALVALPLFFVGQGGQINLGIAFGVLSLLVLQFLSARPVTAKSTPQRTAVPIFTGVLIAKTNVGRVFNTYAPGLPLYKRLPRSMNRMGGTQFTYSFWMQFDKPVTDDMVAGKTILLRGDKAKYRPMSKPEGVADPVAYFGEEGDGYDFTIACPRIFFSSATTLGVDINSDREIRQRFEVGNLSPGIVDRKNIMSLIYGNFGMMTFVFEDYVDSDSIEKGVEMVFYFNGEQYARGTFTGSLRVNDGPIHVFLDKNPNDTTGIDGCRMADLTYYNYALSAAEVKRLYTKGFNKHDAKEAGQSGGQTYHSLDTSPKNMLDVYNFDARLHMLQR